MLKRNAVIHLLCLALAVALFSLAVDRVRALARPQTAPEIQVALPAFVQVGLAAGDRYLAANGSAIRALVTSTERMGEDEYAILGALQTTVSWLNPAHQDNYYTAAAILPWVNEVDAAQTILRRASFARPFDYLPSFLYGFHLLYFKRDAGAASAWLREAAERLQSDDERLIMQNYAARWMDLSRDIDNAIAVVSDMAKQARRQDFRQYLELRVQRLQTLKRLREAASVYEQRFGRPLRNVDELVSSGFLREIPADPFKLGYQIGPDGRIALK